MQNSAIATCNMEVHSLHSTISTSLTPKSSVKGRRLYGQFPKFCIPKKYPASRKVHFFRIRAQQPSGAASFSSTTAEATSENASPADEENVFVAGATGKVGSRTARELLKLGFQVRAGVRSAQRAESLVQSVKQMKLDTTAAGGVPPIEKLEIVECDLEKSDQIPAALGRASVVICCIGASEKEIFDVTGPYRIDYQATKNLIDAATVAKVEHFILVTSLGTNKVGFPAAILNLFWGVLLWKRKAEEALIDSGLPYTIVRPGGMERPTDSFKETHNLVLCPEDTLFGGLVSNLQVAELMAFMAQNRELSYCKIVEVVAETTAPLTPMGELLAKIPSKRAYVYKAKTPEAAGTVEASPPKVSEGAKDNEPPQEKLMEPEAATQLLEPEPEKGAISEVPTPFTGKETAEDKSVVPRPLSPYGMYEDLKPPSSPSPTPPTKQETKVETINVSPEISATSSGISDTDVASSEPPLAELQKKQPLSPYAVYEDLKPPTSPSPSPPSTSKKEPSEASTPVDVPEEVDGALVREQPLSPYAAYEDLKLPTSPSPSPPTWSKVEPSEASKTVDSVPKVIDGTLAEKVAQESTFYYSPYPIYDDLKPPTSPTLAAPNSSSTLSTASAIDDGSQMANTSDNDAVEAVKEEKPRNAHDVTEPKSRPLSPYTMYEDMKPPTSPTPSDPSPRNL